MTLTENWISVDDGLPEACCDNRSTSVDVLIWDSVDEEIRVGYYDLTWGWYINGFDVSGRLAHGAVTHWRPLPSPPVTA